LLIQPCIAYRVDLIEGLYTLTQARVEEQGQVADWDLVLTDFSDQGLDQSPEGPKASAEGKHRSAYNLFGITHTFYFSVFMFCFVHLSFRSCF
jgi:hypothetical protein